VVPTSAIQKIVPVAADEALSIGSTLTPNLVIPESAHRSSRPKLTFLVTNLGIGERPFWENVSGPSRN
jgi:hypothetical protein